MHDLEITPENRNVFVLALRALRQRRSQLVGRVARYGSAICHIAGQRFVFHTSRDIDLLIENLQALGSQFPAAPSEDLAGELEVV